MQEKDKYINKIREIHRRKKMRLQNMHFYCTFFNCIFLLVTDRQQQIDNKVEYHHTTVCNSTLDGGSITKLVIIAAPNRLALEKKEIHEENTEQIYPTQIFVRMSNLTWFEPLKLLTSCLHFLIRENLILCYISELGIQH